VCSSDLIGKKFLADIFDAAKNKAPDFSPVAKEFYDTHQSAYQRPAGVWTSHILLRVDPEDPKRSNEAEVKAKAEKILEQLKNGADFAKLAVEYSEERNVPVSKGDIGWADKGQLVEPYEAAAFALEPGQLSGLVRSRFGFHIIKLHEKRPASIIPYEDVKPQIMKQIVDRYLAEKRGEMMTKFDGSKPVEVDDAFMEALKKTEK
jgi:parvulin-like peptidyl-prolyl isomerase